MAYTSQYVLLTAFLQFSSEQQLVKDEVCFLKVEYDIQLAHVAVVFVHLFNVAVDDLERNQLIVRGGTACDEEEGCISSIDYFAVWESFHQLRHCYIFTITVGFVETADGK